MTEAPTLASKAEIMAISCLLPQMKAMHTYMVKLLLDRCASICARIFGDALQIASVHGHTGVVQVLLNRGADVNAGGVFYGNALQMAYDSGRREKSSR